jgi:hypothetical protein
MQTESMEINRRAKQALIVWGAFIVLNVLFNGTIPFLLGKDLYTWTNAPLKSLLFNVVQYGIMFLVVPLILTKGWGTVRQPAFLLPLLLGILGLALRRDFPPAAVLLVIVLAYLHLRYDLSELGFRSRDWRTDAIVVVLVGLLFSVQRLFTGQPFSLHLSEAFLAGLQRLFLNPASTAEYIFYFGFLAECLSHKLGRGWTPWLIGLMYVLHEMTNPEYWYEGMFFPIIFVGIALFAMVYLWRRNIVVIWLGDGLGWFLSRLF